MRPYLGLLLGVLAVSSAAVLIRFASEAPPLVVGAYRMTIASAVVVPAVLLLARRDLRAYTRADLPVAVASGGFLALHFAFWISSLWHTSVASSVVLVTTSPLWIALLSPYFSRDTVSRRTMVGVGIALCGTAIIAFGDAGVDLGSLWGNALALLGAFAIVGHRFTGRDLRARVSLWAYIAVVYPVAAVVLIGLAVLSGGGFTGYAPQTYAVLTVLGLGPQLVGHSAFNWALGHLNAVTVSTAVMAEPVGATLLAWALLAESPTATQVLGGVVVLSGVLLAMRER